jgi:pimeloyl-ACP methyl ester carboxylesterase
MNKLLFRLSILMGILAVALAMDGQTFKRVYSGGHALRVLAYGHGGATVIFEAGSGSPLEAWVRVQPEVAQFARTISYDRAGNGLSPKGPTPRDGKQIAAELHAALQNLHAAPPYILVGHSLGGPYIRVFAGLFPDEVAGLVLVDPTQEDLLAWAKARDPKPSVSHDPRPYDEVDCAPATFAEARAFPIPTNLPVTLLTGLGPREIPGFLPAALRKEAQKDQAVFYPAKLKFHKDWVEQFAQGRLIITEKSGHGIPFEEPELVISAVHQIVEKTKGGH